MKQLGIGSKIKHSKYGEGVVTRISLEYFTIHFFQHGIQEINRKSEELELIQAVEPVEQHIDLDELEDVFIRVLKRYAPMDSEVPLGDRWKGGTMVLEPGDESLQGKEIPIETFFHKIVMLRDRLRVLEQNINSNKTLSDEEKVHIQQYITRCYGSLTSFNILFKNKDDHFKGAGK